MNAARKHLLSAALSLMAVPPAPAWDQFTAVDLGYSSGDFGTGVDSQLTALTVTISAMEGATDVSVAVPFLSLATDGVATERGVGDVMFRAARRDAAGKSTALHGALSLKLPTGDEDAGLGTGTTDVGISAGLSHDVGALRALVSVGYIVTGESSDSGYDDVTLLSAGLVYRFARGGVYLSWDTRSATIDGGDDPREISLGGYRVVSSKFALTASGFQGLNDGGPDYGMTVGLLHRWD